MTVEQTRFSGVTLEKEGKVGILTVDLPESRNALSVPVVEYLETLVDEVRADHELRALILTGGGPKSFIAGADINKLVKMTPEDARYSIEVGHRVFSKIETLSIPVIAAINGYCLGGGLEIAMCCDIRLCSANAKFGQPEINIGMIPGWGATLRLPQLIGESRAKYLLLTGKMITAEQAESWGLVMQVFPDVEALGAGAKELAAELAAKAPLTMKTTKGMVRDAAGKTAEEIAQRDAMALAYMYTTQDAIEGLTAFLEKRKPNYQGK